MSKTLFNTNTFQSKNVRNSDDVGTLKVDTFKATNAILTNITNAELQAATAGVATNASAISTNTTNIATNAGNISTNATNISNNATAIEGKEDAFTVSEFNPLKKDITENSYVLYVETDTAPTVGSNDVVTSGGLYQYLIDNYNAKLTNDSPLQLSITNSGSGINVNDDIAVILATSASATDFGLVNGAVLNTELSSKQDNLSAGDGININGSNEISLSGTRTGGFSITGNFQSEGTDFTLWNATRGGAGQSNGRALVHQGTGTKATSTLHINYNGDFGAGTKFDSIVGIKTAPDSSYDLKVNGNVNIGGVLSLPSISNVKTEIEGKQDSLTAGTGIDITNNVISATGTGGGTYTAEANGGLAVNASNEFSIDLTNTNATFQIPQDVEIIANGEPQLIVKPSAASGQDGGIAIRGARTSSTSSRHAQLYFQNYDDNLSDTNNLGEIAGLVTNHSTNIGGLAFYNYSDGNSRATAMTMNNNGRFHMGTSFQDTYKLQVTGNTNFTGDAIIGGTLQIAGISNVRTAIEGKQDPISALSGGGLAVSNNQISVDFSNTNATIEIPQRVVIEDDTTAQLIVRTASSGNDAAITIRGERASTSNRQAQLRFENTLSGNNADLAEIAGVVTNAGSNIGGLGIYNFADGSTRTEAMLMNNNGRFHFGDTFQDTYKLQVTGDTNFTGDTNVGGDLNLTGLLVCDNAPVNDDINRILLYDGSTGDYGFGINSNTLTYHANQNHRFIYGSTTAGGGTIGMELSSSNLTVSGQLYRTPRMIFYNFGKTSVTNNLFGKGNYFNGTTSIRRLGDQPTTISSGTITFSVNGTYRIRVGANPVTDGYNDRLAFCIYLRIGSTDYFQNQNYNFHGYTYTRNSSDGAFGNLSFEDYIYITSGTTLQVRHKLDVNNRSFDDQLTNSQMECYCNLQIERIAETDIF